MSVALRAIVVASVIGIAACGHGLPAPKLAPQPKGLYYEVPYPPPAPHAETVTARPSSRAVWIDGEWTWEGSRWVWQSGGWTDPPPGAEKYALWSLQRTKEGRLIFAAGTWLSHDDTPIPPREPASAHACTPLRAEAAPR